MATISYFNNLNSTNLDRSVAAHQKLPREATASLGSTPLLAASFRAPVTVAAAAPVPAAAAAPNAADPRLPVPGK